MTVWSVNIKYTSCRIFLKITNCIKTLFWPIFLELDWSKRSWENNLDWFIPSFGKQLLSLPVVTGRDAALSLLQKGFLFLIVSYHFWSSLDGLLLWALKLGNKAEARTNEEIKFKLPTENHGNMLPFLDKTNVP